MSVNRIMVKDPITINPEASVRDAARIMRDKEIGSVIIVNGKKPIGILTERDIVRRITAVGLNPEILTVEKVCSKPVVAVNQILQIDDAVDIMRDNKIRRLIVVDNDDEVVGSITSDDIGYNLRSMSETLAVKYIAAMKR